MGVLTARGCAKSDDIVAPTPSEYGRSSGLQVLAAPERGVGNLPGCLQVRARVRRRGRGIISSCQRALHGSRTARAGRSRGASFFPTACKDGWRSRRGSPWAARIRDRRGQLRFDRHPPLARYSENNDAHADESSSGTPHRPIERDLANSGVISPELPLGFVT